MKTKPLAKFAYLISDPGKDDNPLLSEEKFQSELECSQILNLTLSAVDSKNNPTSLASKYLKFLKDNYFYFATVLNLYESNKFKSDHYLFLYALAADANYIDSGEFKENISNKYGNVSFIPFYLNNVTASQLVLLSKFRVFLMDLYSAKILDEKKLAKAKDFYPLLGEDIQVKFLKVLDFATRNSKDLDFLVNFVIGEMRALLTNEWR